MFRFLLLLMPLLFYLPLTARSIKLTDQEAQAVGNKIWYNECRNSVDKLTWWKKGEQWASLGIGHFIWYPKDAHGPYTQMFPDLLTYLAGNKIQLPSWLMVNGKPIACPWKSEAEFFADFNTDKMNDVRTVLSKTVELQTRFIVQRLDAALPTLLEHVASSQRPHIKKQFFRVAHSPMGTYALIDYLNFKGEGTNAKERYNNQGWGLLQILERMQGTDTNKETVQQFATIAKDLLTTRVANSPKERNEQQWLAGWHNRIDTYTK